MTVSAPADVNSDTLLVAVASKAEIPLVPAVTLKNKPLRMSMGTQSPPVLLPPPSRPVAPQPAPPRSAGVGLASGQPGPGPRPPPHRVDDIDAPTLSAAVIERALTPYLDGIGVCYRAQVRSARATGHLRLELAPGADAGRLAVLIGEGRGFTGSGAAAFTESSPYAPSSPYSASKAASDQPEDGRAGRCTRRHIAAAPLKVELVGNLLHKLAGDQDVLVAGQRLQVE